MNNEPVAWINRDEYHGWLNWDKNTEMPINIPLYTHQYERPHNTVLVPCDKLAEMQAEIEALKAHPVKEQLTDEEIMEVYKEVSEPFGEKRLYEIHDFARAILRKAQKNG